MFDAEKLLGKMISGLSDSHYKDHKKYKKKYKYKKKDDLVSSLAGNLLSGKGLMTAIGLGVGAYTILKGNNQQDAVNYNQQPYAAPGQAMPGSQPAGQQYAASGPMASPPPPPPPMPPAEPRPAQDSQATSAAPSSAAPSGETSQTTPSRELALKMIRVMIAAAHADGRLDSEEEARILNNLRGAGLSKEEKSYILREFHTPQSIAELTSGMNDPQINHTMYSLAVSTVVIDNEAERKWFDDLAQALSISGEMQRFIEEE